MYKCEIVNTRHFDLVFDEVTKPANLCYYPIFKRKKNTENLKKILTSFG